MNEQILNRSRTSTSSRLVSYLFITRKILKLNSSKFEFIRIVNTCMQINECINVYIHLFIDMLCEYRR